MIKIALVDDHDLFREGIKLVLEQIDGFVVEYNTADGRKFLTYLEQNHPDVVLMDISMPVISGVEVTKMALQIRPGLTVLALSMFSDATHYIQMIDAGVRGFILKKASKSELHQAISTVYSGGNYFSQEIIQRLAFHTKNTKGFNQLTPREMLIMDLICKGRTSKEISQKIFISIKTVETHRANIFRKLKVRNAAELISWAIKNAIFSID